MANPVIPEPSVSSFDPATNWNEFLEDEAPGGGSSFTRETSRAVLVGTIEARRQRAALRSAIGYSYADSGTPWALHRVTPWRHPEFPFCWATQVSFLPRAPAGNAAELLKPWRRSAVDPGPLDYVGNYQEARMSVTFEQVPYDVLPDDDPSLVFEWQRYCNVFDATDPILETLTADATNYLAFKNCPTGTNQPGTKSFGGSIAEYLTRVSFVLAQYEVPEDWLMVDHVPRKIVECLGCVDDRDGFLGLAPGAGFKGGTLLYQGAKLRRYQAPIWNRVGTGGLFFYDVFHHFKFTDMAAGIGSTSTIRGWNLLPWRMGGGVNGGPGWYEAQRPDGGHYIRKARLSKIFEHARS